MSSLLNDWTGERVPVQDGHDWSSTSRAQGDAQEWAMTKRPYRRKLCKTHYFASSHSHILHLLRSLSMLVAVDIENDTHPMSGSEYDMRVHLFEHRCSRTIFPKHGILQISYRRVPNCLTLHWTASNNACTQKHCFFPWRSAPTPWISKC